MNEVIYWVTENAQTVTLSALLALCLATIVGALLWDRRASIKKYLEHRRELRIQRGVAMGRKQKADEEIYAKRLLADIITNGLEEAWFAGKITREKVDSLYRMIGKTHGIPDLMPRMTNAQLKAIVKGRRSRGEPAPAQEHPAWGEPQPAPPKVDGQKPTVTNVISATKRFGDKALKRLQKTA